MSNSSDGSEFKTDITADPGKFEQGMRQAVQAATGASDQINAQFKKVGDAVSKLNSMVMGFTAVLAGGGALKKFISDANEWNGTAGRMASQLGITSQQASVLNVALTRLGIDSDVYVGASQKMSKQIQSNSQAFEVLGVKVRDATGAYRPVTEVMADVNAKLVAIKNPIEQNIAGQQVYGKGWAEIRTVLRLTSEQMKESEAKARQLGLIVGPEGVAMSKQYSMQMRDLGLVGKSLEVQFGNKLLPVFTKTGAFMAQEGPAMGRVFATVLEGIAFAASATWLALKDMGDGIGAMAAQAVALLHGDLEGFKAIGRARDEESAKNEAAYERMKAMFGKPLPGITGPAAPDLSKGPQYHFGKEGEDPAAKSRMAAWEAELSAKKAAIEREGALDGQFREMTKSAELAFWQDLAARKGNTEAEKVALVRKTAEIEMAMIRDKLDVSVKALQAEGEKYKNSTDEKLRIEREIQAKYQQGTKEYEEAQKRIVAIQRQAAEQSNAIALSRAQAERDALLSTVALAEQSTRQAEQMGLISKAQLIEAERGFEDQRYAIASAALREREQLALLDKDRNPVEVERIQREIEKLEQEHQLRLGQIRGQAVMESTASTMQMASTMQSGFAGVFAQIGTGIKSIGGLVSGMAQVVLQTIAQMLAQIAAKWLVNKLLMKGISKVAAVGDIMTEAAKAGAGGVASMAAAPFPLNLSAPAFGASMSALAAGFLPMASAAQGYDIPGTINPIVQTHAREMILPAKHADVIRGLADGIPSNAAPLQLAVQGRSGGDWLMLHRDDIVKIVQQAQRHFALKS